MALQALAMPNITATKVKMSPMISTATAMTWRALGQESKMLPQSGLRRRKAFQGIRSYTSGVSGSCEKDLPNTLHLPPFPSSFTPRALPQTLFHIRHNMVAISRGNPSSANPVARGAFAMLPLRRQMSTALRSRFMPPNYISKSTVELQRRTFFGTANSSGNLASLEQTANKNANSAAAQNTFYQALLKANMPAIIVERYQTNAFATNAACDSAYQRALAALGQVGSSAIGTSAVKNSSLSNAQLQAIGQAVAASSQGANVAISGGHGAAAGTGGKEAPLHVVVEETFGGVIFKWVKFVMYFCLLTYLSLVVVAMVLEAFMGLKKVGGGKVDNEAKAEQQNVRFSDVHGCDEAKEELQELVEFLKDPEKFSTLGGKLPKGVLLVGPPGTGKTLLARAVAGEAGVPFFFVSGSEFDEIYVGVGAKRVRELFTAAKSKSPAIVFIDELDAIGAKRSARDAAYHKQTLNQLLTELDGFEQNSGVIILAATNFPQLLDKALTRPGRFDRNVVVGLPDVRGRMEILKHHIKKIIAGKDVSLETLAQGTPGFSGAELENVVNQAAVHASKAKAQAVSMFDFEWAKDKVMMGAEKKSMIISDREKEMTAYHEAGHALLLMFTPGAEPLHKVTIMPRGGALGMTTHLPEIDKYSKGMNEFEAHIDVCLGGKVAEELVYGPENVTSGCSSDLQSATQIAYRMVTAAGMSPKLGNVDLASNYNSLSAGTKELIESEVRRLIEEGRARATNVLSSKRKELDFLAGALLDYETLNRDEAFKVIKGEKLEGKIIMPRGPIKIPTIGPDSGKLPGVPPIPGSSPDDSGTKEPPSGGAIA